MEFRNRTKPNIYQMTEREPNGTIKSESTIELKRLVQDGNDGDEGTALSAGILNQFKNEILTQIREEIATQIKSNVTDNLKFWSSESKQLFGIEISTLEDGIYMASAVNGGGNLWLDDQDGNGVDTGSFGLIIFQHLTPQFKHTTHIYSLSGDFHEFKHSSNVYISRRSGHMSLYRLTT